MANIELDGPLLVEAPDGCVYEIRPGPQRRGISIRLHQEASRPATRRAPTGEGRLGRPPHPATEALRAKLAADHEKGTVKPAQHYVDWYLKKRPDTSEASARNTVYKERRAFLGEQRPAKKRSTAKARSRASPALASVRRAIEGDAPRLRAPKDYVKVALEADKHLGQKAAKAMVQREVRRVGRKQ